MVSLLNVVTLVTPVSVVSVFSLASVVSLVSWLHSKSVGNERSVCRAAQVALREPMSRKIQGRVKEDSRQIESRFNHSLLTLVYM